MTTKDWILLIVPIISNSLIFYLLHIYFENKMKIKNEYESKQRNLKREIYKHCNSAMAQLNVLIDNCYEIEFEECGKIIIKVLESIEIMRMIVIDNMELNSFTDCMDSIISLSDFIEKETCKLTLTHMSEKEKNNSIKLLRSELWVLMMALKEMKKLCMNI